MAGGSWTKVELLCCTINLDNNCESCPDKIEQRNGILVRHQGEQEVYLQKPWTFSIQGDNYYIRSLWGGEVVVNYNKVQYQGTKDEFTNQLNLWSCSNCLDVADAVLTCTDVINCTNDTVTVNPLTNDITILQNDGTTITFNALECCTTFSNRTGTNFNPAATSPVVIPAALNAMDTVIERFDDILAFWTWDGAAWTLNYTVPITQVTVEEITDIDLITNGIPTTADIQSYIDANDTINKYIYYVGNGTANDPDYTWYVDINGDFINTESPRVNQASANAQSFNLATVELSHAKKSGDPSQHYEYAYIIGSDGVMVDVADETPDATNLPAYSDVLTVTSYTGYTPSDQDVFCHEIYDGSNSITSSRLSKSCLRADLLHVRNADGSIVPCPLVFPFTLMDATVITDQTELDTYVTANRGALYTGTFDAATCTYSRFVPANWEPSEQLFLQDDSTSCVEDNRDTIFVERTYEAWFNQVVGQQTFTVDTGIVGLAIGDVNIVKFSFNSGEQPDTNLAANGVSPIGSDYNGFTVIGTTVSLDTRLAIGTAGEDDYARMTVIISRSLSDWGGC